MASAREYSSLLRARRGAGYATSASFARVVGIPPSTYKDYEARPSRIPLERASAIADALGCTLDEVYGRVPPAMPAAEAYGMLASYAALSRRSRGELDGFLAYLRQRDRRTGQVEREREEARWDSAMGDYERAFVARLLRGEGAPGATDDPRAAFESYVSGREGADEAARARVSKVMSAWDRRHGTSALEYDRSAIEGGGAME